MKFFSTITRRTKLIMQLALLLLFITSLTILAQVFTTNQKVKEVCVTGNKYIPTSEIIQKYCDTILNSSNTSPKLIDFKSSVIKHPFIEDVNVSYNGFDQVDVEVFERVPISVVFDKRNMVNYIDKYGVLLPYKYLKDFSNLPVFRGLNARELSADTSVFDNLKEILHQLSSEEFLAVQLSISEIIYNKSENQFEFITEHKGLRIIFGECARAVEKLYKLKSFMEQKLPYIPNFRYKELDLRWSEQIVLRK